MKLRKQRRYVIYLTHLILLGSFLIYPSESFAIDFYEYEITVVDETGLPLVGVNVYTDDYSKVNAATDIDGKAILKDLKYSDLIHFSYIGYQQRDLEFHQIRSLGGIIIMQPEASDLKEVVVIGRRDDRPEHVPYKVKNITQEELSFTNPQTSADALRDHGDVFVQKSQMGGGSPVIRGFEANRVLLVVDGVRLNNAIYRNGHLQNSITIDNSMLERMEVIFGPGSLMYGSDALGGVVHFRSKDPKLYFGEKPGGYVTETNIYTRFSSANYEKTIHADLNFGKKEWGSLTSLTFSDFDDLEAGNKRPEGYEHFGERRFYAERSGVDQRIENVIVNADSSTTPNYDVQRGTGYSQMDFLQKIRFQPNDKTYFVGNFQYSTTSNVPRYDALTDTLGSAKELKWAEWYYGPQKRLLASIKARMLNPTLYFDKATIIASFQKIDEDRLKRKFNKNKRTFNVEDVFIYSLTADFDKNLMASDRHKLAYGFDVNFNKVNSFAGNVNVENEETYLDALTRYPGMGSTMTSLGTYANLRLTSRDTVANLDMGVRYSHVGLFSMFNQDSSLIIWPQEYVDGISVGNGDLTWGLGLTINTKDNWQIRVLGSSAFRSPNIDDFSKIREKNGYVTIPNPQLRPEKSINTELTVGKEFGEIREGNGVSLKLSATGFYTFLQDAIVRRSFRLPDGSNTLVLDDELLTTQANINAETARVYGYSGNVLLRIGDTWEFKTGINYTYGRAESRFELDENLDTLLTVPMSHIPPMYGQTSLSWTSPSQKFKVAGIVRYNGLKSADDYNVSDVALDDDGNLILKKGGSSDNIDLAYSRWVTDEDGNQVLVEDGTLAWTTYNLYSSWQINDKYSINLALENIFDIHYRPFSSGVSSAGRNFIITLRGNF